MEDLARLVSESMARHGMECHLDYRRLHWSRWFRCEASFDLLQVPGRPGLLAVAEELLAPGGALSCGKRMLALVQVSASEDLAIATARFFAPNHPLRNRMVDGRIFLRYTVIEDGPQRQSAQAALQRWLADSSEAALGILYDVGNSATFTSPVSEAEHFASVHPPAPLPSGF